MPEATRNDLPSTVSMRAADPLGSQREETANDQRGAYEGAFAAILADPNNNILVAKKGSENPFKRSAEYVELDQFGVLEEHRRKGIGAALHTHAIGHCRSQGVKEVRLTVIGFNEMAQQFYESLGFTVAQRPMELELE